MNTLSNKQMAQVIMDLGPYVVVCGTDGDRDTRPWFSSESHRGYLRCMYVEFAAEHRVFDESWQLRDQLSFMHPGVRICIPEYWGDELYREMYWTKTSRGWQQ